MMVHLKIKEIKQGRESMDDYVIQFEEFKGFTSLDDATLTKIFKEGLSPQIISCCYSLEVILATLATWKERARIFHRHYLKLQQQQCHQAGHAITGFVFLIDGGAITWSSKKQELIMLSTTEAKYVMASQATCKACWLWNFIAEVF
jgi:hypothetical protein